MWSSENVSQWDIIVAEYWRNIVAEGTEWQVWSAMSYK